jgi:hypothetical protein
MQVLLHDVHIHTSHIQAHLAEIRFGFLASALLPVAPRTPLAGLTRPARLRQDALESVAYGVPAFGPWDGVGMALGSETIKKKIQQSTHCGEPCTRGDAPKSDRSPMRLAEMAVPFNEATTRPAAARGRP